MLRIRSWNYRLYPSRSQQRSLNQHLYECKELWNFILERTKIHYEKTQKLPTREQLYLLTKNRSTIYAQLAQNVADRLAKSLKRTAARKKEGKTLGFPRFKSFGRVKSFTYPQFGFKLEEKLVLSGIGKVSVRKHREIKGRIKTLTIKKNASGKWFAIFTSEIEVSLANRNGRPEVGIDLGIDHFAHLSDNSIIKNPRHFSKAEKRLGKIQRKLSRKQKTSKNRLKARLRVASFCEGIANRRRDFLHKFSRKLVMSYSLIAMEKLNVQGLSKGFLAKKVLDCAWAEFSKMLHYKAEEAGCELIFVNPAFTTQKCSKCGSTQKKKLAERVHICSCGAVMHRDLNAAINILDRATGGTPERNACGEETNTLYKHNGQVSSGKQETHVLVGG